MTRHEMVKAVVKRMEEMRASNYTTDNALASAAVGVFEDHVRSEFGQHGIRMIFEESND